MQGLLEKEKVNIDCEKGAQISTLANKNATQVRSPNKLSITSIFNFLAELIKKLELCLMVVSDLLKIESGHTQISEPKIGIPMSKTACINP